MPAPLPSLCFGFVLGGAAALFTLRPAAPVRSGEAAPAPGPVTLPAWSWRDAGTPPALVRDEAASAVVAWLALRDPDGRPAGYATRVAALRALLLRLPPEAFSRLVDGLVASDKDDDQRLLSLAFSAWTTRDAAAAAGWAVRGLGKGADERFFGRAHEALRAWSAKDPEAAAVWVCALPDPAVARRLAGQALRTLAESSPERALALARSRDDEFRDRVLPSVLEPLGKKDPAGTLRAFAPELWKNGDGFHSLRGFITAWMKQDSQAALAWLLAQPRPSDSRLSHWFANLGDNTPAWRRSVADALAIAPGLADRATALRDLVFRWGNDQPDEALAWLNQLSDPDLRLDLLARANNSYYSDNPQKSLPLALAMPEGADRAERLSRLLGAWAKIDSDATLAWIREHGSEPGVSAATHAVHGALLADLAREDPQAALAEWRALADPRTRQTAMQAIVNAWGANDPAAALQWVAGEQKSGSGPHYGGYDQLVHDWAKRDPDAALRWVEDLASKDTSMRDYHVSQYLQALGGTWTEKSPRAATAELYTRIRDPKLREQTLARHVAEWLTKDPAAARAWVDSSPALTAEQRARILAPAAP